MGLAPGGLLRLRAMSGSSLRTSSGGVPELAEVIAGAAPASFSSALAASAADRTRVSSSMIRTWIG